MIRPEPFALDRRALLAGAAAGAALLTTTSPAAAMSPSPRRTYKKAVKIGMVQVEGTLQDKFALLKELGFDGVELDSPSNLDLDEVLAAKAATGLEVPGVVDSAHWGKPFSHPDAAVRAEGRAALETALRDCKKVGGTSVLVVPAVVNGDVSYDDAYRRSQEELRQLVPLAEELDVRIAFENVWNNFLLSPLEAARYVDEFESAHVGWHLDLGNLVLYGWPDQWIKILGKRIFKLDLKDYSRKKCNEEGRWAGFGVQIGEGDVGWPAVMKALDELGYTGWGAAEVGGGGRERLAEIAANIDRVYAM
ncbi:MAG: sugar phosphate isomerase/epimerase [Planctomycetes bacterium]|nr:sugar phosphate isomerase/epimerase [Planctomycetota bacterium]